MVSRIKQLISRMGSSTRAFALRCGLRQNTLSNQLNGMRELSLQTVAAILEMNPQISAEWLMRGTGEMFNSEQPNSAELERINKLVDTIATLQDTINLKNETIAILAERNKQLEAQLTTK